MTTEQYLDLWQRTDVITAAQHDVLRRLVRKERFSVFFELNALLYLGVVAFAGGLGWTVHEHFERLGDVAVVLPLAALIGGCFYYCFTRAHAYSPALVESSTFSLDYVLYLGCLAFAAELGYIEFRFHLLRDRWDIYLLASAVVYFLAAYRFDNRFVLSLALSTLAGWFGVKLTGAGVLFDATLRDVGPAYGAVAGVIGVSTHRLGIKPHFLDTYIHIALNVALIGLTAGALGSDPHDLWLVAVLVVSAVAVERGVRMRRFAWVVYGTVYSYICISRHALDAIGKASHDASLPLIYFIASGGAVLVALGVLSRRVGRDE